MSQGISALKQLINNLFIIAQLLVSFLPFGIFAYMATIGIAYQIYGQEIFSSKAKDTPFISMLLIILIPVFISLFFWFHHVGIVLILKNQAVRMLKLNGSESRTIRYLRWYASTIQEFADSLEKRVNGNQSGHIGKKEKRSRH